MSKIVYSKKTISELKAICRELKIKGISKENKQGLIKLINQKETITQNDVQVSVKEELSISSIIDKVCKCIDSNKNKNIVLLRNKEVVQWIFGDLSFLPSIEKKNKTSDELKYKVLEDKWGQKTLKMRRPDLKLDKQWTNKFGEHVCEEIYTLIGKVTSKPENKKHLQLDLEVDNIIIEVKTQTFHTSGTAAEKILGSPFKYADVPELFSKPMKIMCIGGAEKEGIEKYGIFPGPKCSLKKQKFLDFYRENGIEFIAATDILKSIIYKN